MVQFCENISGPVGPDVQVIWSGRSIDQNHVLLTLSEISELEKAIFSQKIQHQVLMVYVMSI